MPLMPEPGRGCCISSAIVLARSECVGDIAASITRLGAEIGGIENGRIIVVMEGPSPGALGAFLSEICNIDGVVAANMVFEYVEEDRCPKS